MLAQLSVYLCCQPDEMLGGGSLEHFRYLSIQAAWELSQQSNGGLQQKFWNLLAGVGRYVNWSSVLPELYPETMA